MKEFLHKVTKIFLILLMITALITVAVVGYVYFDNQSKLKKEASLIAAPPGELVSVDGHNIHVYVTGNEEAEDTLVVLHGTGMADASIAMEPLFEALSAQFRIAYVDRPGNGFSEKGCKDKSVERLTEETREALSKAGIEGEIILFAQTTAGIEAVYWAKEYPGEVKAIVGLDMYSPEEYAADEGNDHGFRYMMYLFSQIGVTRHIDSAYPENRYNLYSDKQLLVRNALISRGSYTKDMYLEDKGIGDNARAVEQEEVLGHLPILLFFSNPIKEPYLSTDASAMADLEKMQESYPDYDFEGIYNEARLEYFQEYDGIECIELAGPSALYTYAPEIMAEEIMKFADKKISPQQKIK